MTEEKIKEYLSISYVSAMAGRRGFFLERLSHDTGVDFMIRYDDMRIEDGKARYITSPRYCDIQIKATTEKGIRLNKTSIIYDLAIKNYNDLIYRRNQGIAPLFLIVFVLPNDKTKWVKLLKNSLVFSKHAYWYFPNDDDETSPNTATKTIHIPKNNRLNLAFFKTKIDEWYDRR